MTAAPSRPERAPTFQETATLGMKAASATALHAAAGLLGGRASRTTSGHNYTAYRLPPAGRTVLVPKPNGSGNGVEVGRSLLRDIVQQFRDAGVPPVLLAYALTSLPGVSWHSEPGKAPQVVATLKERRDLVEKGYWPNLLRLVGAVEPKAAEAPETAETPARPEATETAGGVAPEWTALGLLDAIRLGVPSDADEAVVERVHRSVARSVAFSSDPFGPLLDSGDLERYDGARGRQKRVRYAYRMTERAAMRIAEEAGRRYDRLKPDTEPARALAEAVVAERDAEPAAETSQVSQVSEVPATSAEATADTPETPAQADTPRPTLLTTDEAIWALSQRFDVRPKYRRNDSGQMELRLIMFVRDLEAASRDGLDADQDTFGLD